jgi:hypothetical protein
MKKSDVTIRRAVYGSDASGPAINVKFYGNFPRHELAAYFKVADDAPELDKALEYAWDTECEQFWESAQDSLNFAMLGDAAAGELKPSGTKDSPYTVYSAGRSGGWLVVEGLPDVESWDAVMLGKWARFEKLIRQDIEYRTGFEALRDDIEVNEWLKPGAEKYNFIDVAGETKCIADLKAGAIAAGFGPVVRK